MEIERRIYAPQTNIYHPKQGVKTVTFNMK